MAYSQLFLAVLGFLLLAQISYTLMEDDEDAHVSHGTHGNARLTILGAAYGPRIVTGTVSNRVTHYGSLSIPASNGMFGDPWRGIVKTLVVVYQQEGYEPRVAITQERHTMKIYSRPKPSNPCVPNYISSQLRILGAAYGLADVTAKVQALVRYNHLNVAASNAVFGDSWRGIKKTLVVVYRYGRGSYRTKVATEGNRIQI
jgi:hypothetical protein